MRTPQKPESLTREELAAIKKQLIDAIAILDDADSVMRSTSKPLFVLYRSSFNRALDSLRRMQESIYRSSTAMRQGRPLNSGSVSSRSVTRKKAEAIVQEEVANVKNARKVDASKKRKPKGE